MSADNTGMIVHGTLTADTLSAVGHQIIHHHTYHNPAPTRPPVIDEFTAPCREFTGRESELARIKEALSSWYEDESRENSVDRTFIIHGFGGMGKSNLAFKFAQLNRRYYDCIFQIGAQTKETMISGLKAFAENLWPEIRGKHIDITKEEVKRVYKRAAEVYQRVLIIFDNAERLHTNEAFLASFGIFNYLANDTCIRNKPMFLVTTRNGGEAWEAHGESADSVPPHQRLRIDAMGAEEAYDSLLGQFRLKDHRPEIRPELRERIQELANLLGGYPLSMSLIASIIARKVRSEAFREDLESQTKYYIKQLSPLKIQEHEGDQKHQAQLSLIFKETLRHIELEEGGDMAKQLLAVIALMQPRARYADFCNSIITRTKFKAWDFAAPILTCEQFTPAVQKGLKVLQAYSVISLDQVKKEESGMKFVCDTIRVHRLVQVQIRARAMQDIQMLKAVVEFIGFRSYRLSPDVGEEILEVLLLHCEVQEAAKPLLTVFWRLISARASPLKLLKALKGLQSVSECLCEEEKVLLGLGEIYYSYKTMTPSAGDRKRDSNWIMEGVSKLSKEYSTKSWVLKACSQTMAMLIHDEEREQKPFEAQAAPKLELTDARDKSVVSKDTIMEEGYLAETKALEGMLQSSTEEAQVVNREPFANWLFDQIAELYEIAELAQWMHSEFIQMFYLESRVHVGGPKYVRVLTLMAQYTLRNDNFLLHKYSRIVERSPCLSHEDKRELLLIFGDVIPANWWK